MPEGDTIFRSARTLHQALAGRVVTRFATALAPLARVHDQSPVTGRTVVGATARGKHLLIELTGGLVLRTHMRMSGSWHLYRPGDRWRLPRAMMRIAIATDAFEAVAFGVHDAELVDARSLGRGATGRLGPDLLAADFDEREAMRRARLHDGDPIAAVLLDQTVAAGIGNVYKSEVLFTCGVHPETPVGRLADEALMALLRSARRLLNANVGTSASRRDPAAGQGRRTTGRMHPDERLWVYQREGRPCRRCGTTVEEGRAVPQNRRTYFCPRCQPRNTGTETTDRHL